MSGTRANQVNLPQYIKDGEFMRQEDYLELQSLILALWFNPDGFKIPPVTNAQAAAILNLKLPAGTLFYNIDDDCMQFIGATGEIQTVSSSY